MESISLVTYTNSVMKDAWEMYFGQIDKHFKINNSFVFSNEECSDYENHNFIKYDNSDPYYKQYLGCLKEVQDNFLIYMQEDFFLYEDVDEKKLQTYVNFLKENNEYSFVRLLRCGYVENTRGAQDIDSHVQGDMYEVNLNSKDSFSMQPTLWRKEKLVELYDHVKSEKWLEADHWFDGCVDLNTKGVMIYNGEDKRGKFHYDSIVFPYTCTGITKGRWNMQNYGEFLSKMFLEYNIDPYDRGMRLTENYYTK